MALQGVEMDRDGRETKRRIHIFHGKGIENDRLYGLVVRVPGYRSRGPWFDSRPLPDFLRSSGLCGGTYRILVVKSEAKRPLERPRCRWADNIKFDLRKKGLDGMEWIGQAQ
jgi:hypothetical protein